MRGNHQPVNGTAPDPNAWRENAATLDGQVIAWERGSVQFVGHAPFAITETVIAVPIAQLFMLVAQLLGAPHEAQRAAFIQGELQRGGIVR